MFVLLSRSILFFVSLVFITSVTVFADESPYLPLDKFTVVVVQPKSTVAHSVVPIIINRSKTTEAQRLLTSTKILDMLGSSENSSFRRAYDFLSPKLKDIKISKDHLYFSIHF